MNCQRLVLQRAQCGFSIIELMIAMTIGLFMVAAVLVAYVSAAQNFRVQQAMTELQEDGRFAVIQLLHDIRQSGYGRDSDESKVLGVEQTPAALNELKKLAREISGKRNKEPTIDSNRIESLILFLPVKGREGAVYYLASKSKGRMSLYRNGKKDGSSELVEGAEGLVFELGLDDTGDGIVNNYKPQSQMAKGDWEKVQSVRFHLLLASTQKNITSEAQTLPEPFSNASATRYCYPTPQKCNRQVDTSDRRLYRVFVGTAMLRNAVL